MRKLYNLARMSTATTGTGTITLGSAVSGYLSFDDAGVADGDIVSYGIRDGSASEAGKGTYTASGTTLTRTVLKSTNSDSAIDLSGDAEVYITPLADDLLVSGRNRVINGTMLIDQINSGSSTSITAGGGVGTVIDGFYVSCTGANVTGQQVAGPTGFAKCYQLTGAASVTQILFGTRLESVNCGDLVSQNVTIQANMSNSLLTSVTWKAYSADAADNFTSKTQIATGTWTVGSSAATYTATFNAGSSAGKGIAIEFTVGAQTSGTWKITGVQLECGEAATTFEPRHYAQELMLCQRYYETGSYNVGSVAPPSGGLTGRGYRFPYGFRVTKRTTPTVTITETVATRCSTATVDSVNAGGFTLRTTNSNTDGDDFSTNGTWTAVATL